MSFQLGMMRDFTILSSVVTKCFSTSEKERYIYVYAICKSHAEIDIYSWTSQKLNQPRKSFGINCSSPWWKPIMKSKYAFSLKNTSLESKDKLQMIFQW